MPYCDVGDARLYYEVADFTDPWRPADTVILHHSAMGNLTRWYAWVPHLARHFRVVRFDVRGHGNSSPLPPDYQWSVDVLAQDVAKLLDHLEVESAHYAGASAGGIAGIRFARNHPDRLKTLTLVSSKAGVGPGEKKPDYARWVEIISAEGVEAFLKKDALNRFNRDADPGMVDWFAREGGRNDPRAVAGFVAHMTALDQRDLLPGIQCPTLVLSAGNSAMSPLSTQQYMLDHLPDAEHVVIEGMAHNIFVAAADRCAQEMLAFLKRRGFA
jgi:pimeloyl-ACP methyl ester carboxylesterase